MYKWTDGVLVLFLMLCIYVGVFLVFGDFIS